MRECGECGSCGMGVENYEALGEDDVIYCCLWEDYHGAGDYCEEWERKGIGKGRAREERNTVCPGKRKAYLLR